MFGWPFEFRFLLRLKATPFTSKMESSKYVNPAESAFEGSPSSFLEAHDADFASEMAVLMESVHPCDDIFTMDEENFSPPMWSESDEDIQQVKPEPDVLDPPSPAESDVSQNVVSPALEIAPEPYEVEVKMEMEEEPVEEVQCRVARAPISRRRPVPIHRTKAYRAAIKADAHGLNMYDRLLAKMPKSKAGRKKKFVTTNMTRNALAARENRDKKKEYVEELEEGVRGLNHLLKKVLDELEESDLTNNSLKKAVSYYVGLVSEMKSSAFQREG